MKLRIHYLKQPKKLHYFSSVLLENNSVRDTFLGDTKNMKAMTDMLNHFDELSAVLKLYRNETTDKCTTKHPSSWIIN